MRLRPSEIFLESMDIVEATGLILKALLPRRETCSLSQSTVDSPVQATDDRGDCNGHVVFHVVGFFSLFGD